MSAARRTSWPTGQPRCSEATSRHPTTMVDSNGATPSRGCTPSGASRCPATGSPDTMKLAITSRSRTSVSPEHNGVDWKGHAHRSDRLRLRRLRHPGGSTIEQQYVKNYQLLVLARNDAEEAPPPSRRPRAKLREIRMALSLDRTLSKPGDPDPVPEPGVVWQRRLGIRSQTYRDRRVESELGSVRAAGMVQSTSTLNPYINPGRGPWVRRNLVLDDDRPAARQSRRAAGRQTQQPLGIPPSANELPRGCIAAGDRNSSATTCREYHPGPA